MPRKNENAVGAKPKSKAKRKGGSPSQRRDVEAPTSLIQRRRGSGRGGRGR